MAKKLQVGVIILILNHKGGVGKTTTAVNISHALGRAGRRVLLIDADSQCNTTMLATTSKTPIEPSLYHLLTHSISGRPFSPADAVRSSTFENVDILPNQEETAGLEMKIMELEAHKKPKERFTQLRDALRTWAKTDYDYTVVDLPPNIGTFVLMALNMADAVIVPIDADSAFSHRGLKNAINIIEHTREENNPNLKFLRLLVNKVDQRTALGRVAMEHFYQMFGKGMIFNQRIPVSTHFQQAEARRQSIFHYNYRSVGSKAFTEIAAEIMATYEGNDKQLILDGLQ